jgi:hypothetical protein
LARIADKGILSTVDNAFEESVKYINLEQTDKIVSLDWGVIDFNEIDNLGTYDY